MNPIVNENVIIPRFELDERPVGGSIYRVMLRAGTRAWPTAIYVPKHAWDKQQEQLTEEFAGLTPDVANEYLDRLHRAATAEGANIQELVETVLPKTFRAITVLSVRRSLERLCASLYRDHQQESVSRNFNVTNFPQAGWDKHHRGFASASTNQRLDEHIERLFQFAWHTPVFTTEALYQWEGKYVPPVAFSVRRVTKEVDEVLISLDGAPPLPTGILVSGGSWNALTEEVEREYGENSAEKINATLAKVRYDIQNLKRRKRA